MDFDTLIIGAGAAGLICAAQAPGKCLVIDHAKAAGEKIRISGGGRCNFTNLYASAENYISRNPHFAKSALARYTQWDFIDWVARSGIAYHEKTLGQLFCDTSAKEIVAMLLKGVAKAGGRSSSTPLCNPSQRLKVVTRSSSAARMGRARSQRVILWSPAVASPSQRWGPPTLPSASPSNSAFL